MSTDLLLVDGYFLALPAPSPFPESSLATTSPFESSLNRTAFNSVSVIFSAFPIRMVTFEYAVSATSRWATSSLTVVVSFTEKTGAVLTPLEDRFILHSRS